MSSLWSDQAARDLFAGTCAGIVSLLCVHPLDTIRVRLQTNREFKGITDVCIKTVKHEGISGFYKGITPPLFAQGIQKATMFFSYGVARRYLSSLQSIPQPLAFHELFVCGSFAGTCNALVANPIELIRNRLQVQYSHKDSAQFKGPIDCMKQTVRAGGVLSLWRGVYPMIIRDVPGVGAYYATFEWAKRALTPSEGSPGIGRLMLSGACAGIGFWTCAYPQDAIKSVIQTLPLDTPKSQRGFVSVGRRLVREEGIGRLWRGFSVALIRGIPGAAVTFTTYQLVAEALAAA